MLSMTKLTIASFSSGIKAAKRKPPNPTRLQNESSKQNGLDEHAIDHITINGENDKKRIHEIIDVDAPEGTNPSTYDNTAEKKPVPPTKRPKIDVAVPGKSRYVDLPTTKETPLRQAANSRGLESRLSEHDPFSTGFKKPKDGNLVEEISSHFKTHVRSTPAIPGNMRRTGLTQPNPSQIPDRGPRPPKLELAWIKMDGETQYQHIILYIGKRLLFQSAESSEEITKVAPSDVHEIKVSSCRITLTQTDDDSFWCLIRKNGRFLWEIDFRISTLIEILRAYKNRRGQGSV
jgi:hypothetical protein